MGPIGSLSAKNRVVLETTIVLLALLLLAVGWTIPFRFASSSILYKFGMEKIYLRSGKVIGITIAVLLFFQIILASRLTILAQVFSVKWLLSLHRANGMSIALLIISHPLLIKASENFTAYTFEKKYYPEFLGMAVLALMLTLSLSAIMRKFFRFSYSRWRLLHRLIATLVLLFMPLHILFVSETFKSGVPRQAALIIFSLNLLMITRIWLQNLLQKIQMSQPHIFISGPLYKAA